jgi:hypothetical protein
VLIEGVRHGRELSGSTTHRSLLLLKSLGSKSVDLLVERSPVALGADAWAWRMLLQRSCRRRGLRPHLRLEVTSHNGNRADGGDGRPRRRKEGGGGVC